MSNASRLSPKAAAHALRSVTLPDVFGPSEIARRTGVDESGVLRELEAGRLPGRRLGDKWLISRLALFDWLADRRLCAKCRAAVGGPSDV